LGELVCEDLGRRVGPEGAALLNFCIVGLAVLLILSIARPAEATSDNGVSQSGAVIRDCPDCPDMVVIPAGSFLMGSSTGDSEHVVRTMTPLERLFGGRSLATEHPQHRVNIGHRFGLGKYLVTRGQFAAFVQATGYVSTGGCEFYHLLRFSYHDDGSWQNPGFPQTDQDPVVCVNWSDTHAYIDWLNATSRENTVGGLGGLYRLPSEAEWEYAARAGTRTARWWGDDIGTNRANCVKCGSLWDNHGTAPVGSFGANQFGLYDVLGNAGEWLPDCWHPNYDGAPSTEVAWIDGDCRTRVVRGQAWANEPWTLRSAERIGLSADRKYSDVGFRVAKTLP